MWSTIREHLVFIEVCALQSLAPTVWSLVGNGGMDYGDYSWA